MNIFDFASDSPILFFFLFLVSAMIVEVIIKTPFREINIYKHGWPPEHCDSDGGIKRSDDEEKE